MSTSVSAQNYFRYQQPVEKSLYSAKLADTINYEILLPKTIDFSSAITYPLIIVFDKQNQIGYSHTLHTIDYLTAHSSIPDAIIMGMSLEDKQRNRWTLPNYRTNGKADDFLDFILGDLKEAQKDLPINEFTLLIGHSRTAIFSSYALSKAPEKINAVFGASLSYFDFGDDKQKDLFELSLTRIKQSKRSTYYYFSVGGKENRDKHEESVLQLKEYLQNTSLPENFHWKFYHKQAADHFTSYGLAVGEALYDLFTPYREARNESFTILNSVKYADEVPWEDFEKIFERKSSLMGFTLEPDYVYYNSIASHFGYASNVEEENRTRLQHEVLLKAIQAYAYAQSFQAWLAELYLQNGNKEQALYHYKKALELIGKDNLLSDAEKTALTSSISGQIRKIQNSL